jgi:hypothetical protein
MCVIRRRGCALLAGKVRYSQKGGALFAWRKVRYSREGSVRYSWGRSENRCLIRGDKKDPDCMSNMVPGRLILVSVGDMGRAT